MIMTFTLVMDRPIVKGTHYISPGGYCLRFYGKDGSTKDLEFDFCNYEGNIEKGNRLNCSVRGLDTSSFPESMSLINMLSSYKCTWVDFYVYTGESSEAVINPVKAVNVCISEGSKQFKLPDYFFPGAKINLTNSQLESILQIMNKPIRFCLCRQMLIKNGGICFYESAGSVYLCTLKGNGYCYNMRSGGMSSIGFYGSQDSLNYVKGIFIEVLENITARFPIPVKRIFVPYGKVTQGYLVANETELGTYDIVLK